MWTVAHKYYQNMCNLFFYFGSFFSTEHFFSRIQERYVVGRLINRKVLWKIANILILLKLKVNRSHLLQREVLKQLAIYRIWFDFIRG